MTKLKRLRGASEGSGGVVSRTFQYLGHLDQRVQNLKPVRGLYWFLSSNAFFYTILALFIAQALWFAVSLSYPSLFDEEFHFRIVKAFSNEWLPVTSNQHEGIYNLRDLRYESSYLYHFVLSFPLRVIMLFTDSVPLQVIPLRLLNIGFMTGGLLIFRNILLRAGFKQVYINIGYMFFAAIPMIPLVASTINYDNAQFLLFPIFVLVCIRLADKNSNLYKSFSLAIIVGTFTALIKFTFMPVLGVGILYALFLRIRSSERKPWKSMADDFRNTKLWIHAPLATGFILTAGLFMFIYGQNVIRFGTFSPKCDVTSSLEVCRQNPIYERNYLAKQSKEKRQLMPLYDYIFNNWRVQMTGGMATVAAVDDNGNLRIGKFVPMMYDLLNNTFIIGVLMIAFAWRKMKNRRRLAFKVLLVLSLTVPVVLLLYNLRSYLILHAVYANQARYIMYSFPLLFTLFAYAGSLLLNKFTSLKMLVLVVFVLLLTQGGGILSYAVQSQDNWFWKSATLRHVNSEFKQILQPIIRENR